MDASPSSSGAVEPAGWSVSLFVSALGLWMGAAAFFSAVVLPTLILHLETSEAGSIAALLFPFYFRVGLGLGAITTTAAALVGRGGGRRWIVVVALLASITAAQAWTTLVIHPEMAIIRGVDSEVVRFQSLHQLSVRLNGVVLGVGMLVLLGSGFLLRRREPLA
jgi:hypothetical protein